MSFDPVHDTQQAYRILLDCMAHPGKRGNLGTLLVRLDLETTLDKGLLLLGLTLLDGETCFAVPSKGLPEAMVQSLAVIEGFLARICSSRIEAPEQAAFLFLPRVDAPSAVDGVTEVPALAVGLAVQQAFRGTLIDPHSGATVLLEIVSLGGNGSPTGGNEAAGPGGCWILAGPGIENTAELHCGSQDVDILREALLAREQACSEFPLGIDLILVDQEADVVCIPRTSLVREA